MSLLWYLNRLRSMPAREVVHRAGEAVKRTAARGRLEGWDRYRLPAGPAPRLAGLRERVVGSCAPQARQAIATASANLLAGGFAALGVDWPRRPAGDVFVPSIWALDPVTTQPWPGADRYCFDVPYRHERRRGDVKYVWEFNRLQFLQPLAAEVALSGDERALSTIEAAIASWYAANPPFRGLGWCSGIEIALRSISLLVAATLCGAALSPPTIGRVRTMLRAHLFWLARYPSRFSSANNHRIAEAAGEFLIAVSLPDFPDAAAVERQAREILEEEAARQILPDGVPGEQSPTYGAFTAEFLLLCSLVADAEGRPLSAGVRDRLLAFATFVGWLSDGSGHTPGIGDDDEGRVLTTTAHEDRYPASVASCITAWSGMPFAGPDLGEQTFRTLVFGATHPPAAPEDGLKVFAEGGYSVVREHRANHAALMVFDHGPLGYLSIAAHGHADALALTLTVDDHPVLVDAGTYLYHAGGAWRDWFRGTQAHNTLSIGGADQSVISGPFNWSHKAQSRLDESAGGRSWRLRASHDGYRSRFGVRHERTIAATATGYTVTDRLLGAPPPMPSTITFLLDAACQAVAEPEGVLISAAGNSVVRITPASGDLVMEQGWVSPRFGHKVPTTALLWQGAVPPDGISFALDLV